jgi:hypothetical protein
MEGAAIIMRLDTCPLDNPNANNINMKSKSDEMNGLESIDNEGRWTLHSRNNGMKNVRKRAIAKSFEDDQI